MVALELTVREVNTILNGLGQLPYRDVYELITNIHAQAAPQVGAEPAPGSGAGP
jgi:hypothetical protein